MSVIWPAGASSSNVAQVTLSGGGSASSPVTVPTGGGTAIASGIDASALAEGTIAVSVTTTDPAGNVAMFWGTAATKDTIAPASPTAAFIAAGAGNAAGVINIASAASVSVSVTWPGSASGADVAQVTLLGGGSVSFPIAQAAGGGTATASGIDASGLADGAIAVVVTTTDAAGNVATFTGSAATKDTVAPAAPTAAFVAAGVGNAANVVNIASAGAVFVSVTWPASATGTDAAQVTLAHGGSVSAAVTEVAGGGTATTAAINTSSLADGAVTVSVTTTDAAGNVVTFTGTAATKDTVAPPAPTAEFVAAGAGNAANVVNIASAGSVAVSVVWPAAATGADTALVTLTSGGSVSAAVAQIAGGGTATASGINAASLSDGIVAISVTTTDGAGNTTTFTGTPATKDTVAPASPTSALVAAGAANAANVINVASHAAVAVTLVWPAAASGSDAVSVTLAHGASLSVPGTQAAGGGTTSVSGIDTTPLADGTVTVSVTTTDGAGNVATFSGTAATKDTVAPVAPTAASVAAGGGNAANVINLASAGAVAVSVTWPAGASGTDAAQVTLTSGASVSSSVGQTAGGGTATASGINTGTLSDGAVSVSVTVTDAAGNVASFTGTPATKDTVAPASPTALSVAAGASNAANVINIASQGAVSVAITWPATASAADVAQLTLSGGATASVPVTPVSGGGAATSTVNASALTDGAIAVTVTTTDAAGNVASFTGTPAVKDTVAPVSPTAASVSAGAGNAANVVNVASAASVLVSVTWPATASGSDTAQVSLAHGATVSAAVSQVAGGGTAATSAINASALTDGVVTVTVTTTDAAGNSTTFTGTSATKDTVPPASPTAAAVVAGAGNAVNVINIASQGAVSVSITWPASASGSDTAQLTLAGGTSVSVPATQPAGGGTVTVSGINAASLADGAVSVSVTTTDAAGNTATFTGTAATKDTIGPVAPTSASVAAGASNPANAINAATAGAVSVSVVWPASASGTDTAQVTLTGGASASAAVSQPAGGGTATSSPVNASAISDGAVAVSVTVTDPHGNSTTFAGTAAVKDVVPPVAATAASVAAGTGNAANVINVASAGAVSVTVAWPASASGSDSAFVRLTRGASVSKAVTPVAGGGTATTSGIVASALTDGAVTVEVVSSDAAGNTATFTGTPATKDTVPPVSPTAVVVAAGGSNAASIINIASVSAVSVSVTWPASASGADAAQLSLAGGATVSASVSQTAGGGTVTVSGINASTLTDGTVSLSVTTTDTAGNVATFAGTAATKDTIAPQVLLVDPTTTPTSATTQAITGETDPGMTVSITGGSATATGTASSTGRFSITTSLTASASNGLTVTARDAAGNPKVSTLDFTGATLLIVQSSSAPPLSLTDITMSTGLGDVGAARGGSFQDLDNDGDLDLFIGGTDELYVNNGSGVFTNITASAGVTFNADTSAVFADYDNDGDLDLMCLNSSGVLLFRNEWIPNGTLTFTDVTASSGATIAANVRAGFWLDLDQDGKIDFVATDSGSAKPWVRRNLGGTFATLTTLFSVPISQNRFGVVADIVKDGRPDLLIGDATPSFLYRNDGGLTFTNIAGATSNVSINQTASAGIIAVDVDNDGDLDIIAARAGTGSTNKMFLNNGTSSFTATVGGQNVGLRAGIEPSDGWRDLCAGDVNNDGKIDLLIGRNGVARLFFNQGDAALSDGIVEFVEAASACGINTSGDARMVQLADIDGDGDLDIFLGNNSSTNEVYRNNINNHRNLTVIVHGLGTGAGTSSKDGIGSRVELLNSAGTTILASREINGGRGYGSQDPLRAHFGVTPSEIYTVRVTFPSGIVQTVSNVVPRDLTNQRLTVTE